MPSEEEEKDVFGDVLVKAYKAHLRHNVKIVGDMNAKEGKESIFKSAIGA
jgi:hypothetical protein